MVAQQCDLEPGEFICTGGDCHLYLNHLEQARSSSPRAAPAAEARSTRPLKDIFDYRFDDFEIITTIRTPAIKAPIAV